MMADKTPIRAGNVFVRWLGQGVPAASRRFNFVVSEMAFVR
jgi:hypothetical protein